MPLTREPLFHDRQRANVVGPITTDLDTFTLVTGSTLTAKDLGQAGSYLITVSLEMNHTKNNSEISFRFCIDDVPAAIRTIHRGPNTADSPAIVSITALLPGVGAGTVISIEWATDLPTAQINDLIFVIDGVPESRIL